MKYKDIKDLLVFLNIFAIAPVFFTFVYNSFMTNEAYRAFSGISLFFWILVLFIMHKAKYNGSIVIRIAITVVLSLYTATAFFYPQILYNQHVILIQILLFINFFIYICEFIREEDIKN